MKHLLKLLDCTPEEITSILDLADQLKYERKHHISHRLLEGKSIGLIFQKSSTRTRVSFETGMFQLGGQALFLSSRDLQIGRGEPVQDTARVLSRYLDGIMIRTYAQKEVEDLAEYGSIPIINGLTDKYHPCQALADMLTFYEYKHEFEGRKLTFIGDGNNVCHSLMIICAKLGVNFSCACPKGYEPDEDVVANSLEFAKASGAKIIVTQDPVTAIKDADAVYTDVWASMGQESEFEEKSKHFLSYQVNSELMKHAKSDAIFLHCLPAHRGEEVTAEVIDGSQSVVFDEAENRLHAQKAVMALLMEK